MAHQVPTTEPDTLRAGDTWTWRRDDLTDYPAPGWVLTYAFRNASANFDVSAGADGAAHLVEVAPAVTAPLVVGDYTWFAYVTDGANRHAVGEGHVSVLPDLSVAANFDGRSHNRKILDAVEAILEKRATVDQLDLVASAGGGMQATRDVEYLRAEHSRLKNAVKRDEGGGGRVRIFSARTVSY